MDLYKAIRDLYVEKERLDKVIASLQDLQGKTEVMPPAPKSGKRRPRSSKSQDAGEESAAPVVSETITRQKKTERETNAEIDGER